MQYNEHGQPLAPSRLRSGLGCLFGLFELRRTILAVLFMLVGAGTLSRSLFTSLPEFAELTRFEAVVAKPTSANPSERSSRPRLQLAGVPETLKFRGSAPDRSARIAELRAGQLVTVWSDVPGRNQIWQLTKDGQTVVSYDEVRRSADRNRKLAPWIGGVLFLFGSWGVGRRLHRRLTY